MDGNVARHEFRRHAPALPPDEGCHELDAGHRYRVRRHCLMPGRALAPCSHLHRAEHWLVVQGTAQVTVAGSAKLVSEGQSFLVPLGQVHALVNPGHIPLVLIEVLTGTYLDDDDVIPADRSPES